MKKVMWLAVAIAFAAGALSAFVATDYWPLAVGNYWVYSDSTASSLDSSSSTIVGTATWEGTPCFVSRNVDYSDSTVDSFFVFFDAGSLWMVEYDPEEGDYYMILALPAVFDIGSSWDVIYMDTSWTEDSYEYFYEIHVTATLERLEDVVAPAGLFSNCLEVLQSGYYKIDVRSGGVSVYSDSSDMENANFWYAEDVGMVKYYSYDSEDSVWITSKLLRSGTSDIDEAALPSKKAIAAYPNPFNAAITIDVPKSANQIEVYDLHGGLVDRVPVNFGQARWNPSRSTESGMYLVKVKSGGEYISKKIVLLK